MVTKKSKKTATNRGGLRAGAGRKPKYEDGRLISAIVPADLLEKLEGAASDLGISRNAAIVELLRDSLNRRSSK